MLASVRTIANTTASVAPHKTTAPIEPGESGSFSPEWVRVSDARPLWGLTRTVVYRLIADGHIRSICLRQPGRATGIRLLSAESVRAYLRRLDLEEQA